MTSVERPPWVRSQFHAVVQGPTGVGKTGVANTISAAITERLVFFFNTQHKGYVWGETIEYRGEEDNHKILSALKKGVTKFDIRPESLDPDEEHADLVDFLFGLSKQGVRSAIINDESHEYGGQKNSSVHKLMSRGRAFGDSGGAIKSINLSQRFVGHEASSRSEAKYCIQVGLPKEKDESFLRKERGFPVEKVRELHSQPRFEDVTEGGETVSRAVSVEKQGDIEWGPYRVHPRYVGAEA